MARWPAAPSDRCARLSRRHRPELSPCPSCWTACRGYLDRGFQRGENQGRPAGADRRCGARSAAVREADRPGHRASWSMPTIRSSVPIRPSKPRAEAFKPNSTCSGSRSRPSPTTTSATAEIAEASGVPLAMGENLHTIHEFEYAFRDARLSLHPAGRLQLRRHHRLVAAWPSSSRKHGIPVCSHGMQELHVSLVSARSPTPAGSRCTPSRSISTPRGRW